MEGGLKILLCVDVEGCNNGKRGVSLLEEAQIMINGSRKSKEALLLSVAGFH
jgi:hypothetical protein